MKPSKDPSFTSITSANAIKEPSPQDSSLSSLASNSDLLFGASRLNLRIRDLAVRYHARTYGTTNISRFRHGLLLLRMSLFAARKLKFT